MSVSSTTKSILEAIEKYQDFLCEVDEDEFQISPAEGVWSYSEVFSHIIQANLRSLLAIQKCLYAKSQGTGSIPLIARAILLFGKFPPIKLKAPANIAALVKKISREEARNDLIKLKTRVLELTPKVSKCPENSRMKHPRLGMLNAVQWLRFIEIHSYHHLKQLRRIRKMISR
jgi:hypothetical protein